MEITCKTKSKLTYNPTPGCILRKTIIQRCMYHSVHCSTVYSSLDWGSSIKGASTEEEIGRCAMYTMEYYSSHRKEQNNAVCRDVDGPRGCHTN